MKKFLAVALMSLIILASASAADYLFKDASGTTKATVSSTGNLTITQNLTGNVGFFDQLGTVTNKISNLFTQNANVDNLTVNGSLLVVDGVKDKVGINTTNPTTTLHINGILNMSSNRILNVSMPIHDQDAVPKAYSPGAGSSAANFQLVKNFEVAPGQTINKGDAVNFNASIGKIQSLSFTAETSTASSSFNAGGTKRISAIALDSTYFVVSYINHATTGVYAKVCEASGTTYTCGAEYRVDSGFNEQFNVVSVSKSSGTNVFFYWTNKYQRPAGKFATVNKAAKTLTFKSEMNPEGITWNEPCENGTANVWPGTYKFIHTACIQYRMTLGRGEYNTGTNTLQNYEGESCPFYGMETDFEPHNYTMGTIAFSDFNPDPYVFYSLRDQGLFIEHYLYGGAYSITNQSVIFGVDQTTVGIELAAIHVPGTTKFVVAYTDIKMGGRGKLVVVDITGNQVGEPYVFSEGAAWIYWDRAMVNITSNQFALIYQDQANGNVGRVLNFKVDGMNILSGGSRAFSTQSTPTASIVSAGTNSAIILYSEWNGGGYDSKGEYLTGPSADNLLVGIANQSGVAGDKIPVILAGVSTVHSGLTSGKNYYVNSTGQLTTHPSTSRAGLAISSTEVLLDADRFQTNHYFGDMIFLNNFRITEGQDFSGLIFKNHLGKELLDIRKSGQITITNILKPLKLKLENSKTSPSNNNILFLKENKLNIQKDNSIKSINFETW